MSEQTENRMNEFGLIFGIQNFFMQKVLDLFSSKLLLRCMDLSSAHHICDVKKN